MVFYPPLLTFYKKVYPIIRDSFGLEIGGPSKIFSRVGYIPVYPFVRSLDNVNFSNETIWEGQIKEEFFNFENKVLGKQFIKEASILDGIEPNQYDFVISSEMIQHIANPLRALYEWKRILVNDGFLILIVPNMNRTFDHRRELTTLQHLIDDYNNNTGEDDLTHLAEILKKHDLSRDQLAGSFEQFKNRSENNFKIRALHHHVFNETLVKEMLTFTGFKIIDIELFFTIIIVLAKKTDVSE